MPISYNKTSKVKTIMSKILPGFVTNEKHREQIGDIKEAFLIEKLELIKEKEEAKILSKKLEFERYLNNLLIYVDKEGKLYVAFGFKIINEDRRDIALECVDVFTEEHFIPNGKIILFTEKKLDALLKLTQQDRVLLFFWYEHKGDCEIEQTQTISKQEIMNKLKNLSPKIFP